MVVFYDNNELLYMLIDDCVSNFLFFIEFFNLVFICV